MSAYKWHWWDLSFPHVMVDTKNRIWSEKFVVSLTQKTDNEIIGDHLVEELDRICKPLGSLGVERAYKIVPPATDFSNAINVKPGMICFARKGDLMMFKLTI